MATVAGGCEALLRLRKDAERRVAVDAAALVAAVVAGLESDGLDGEALGVFLRFFSLRFRRGARMHVNGMCTDMKAWAAIRHVMRPIRTTAARAL